MTTTIQPEEIMARAKDVFKQVRDWRRTIHAHPEISFTEVQTARLVQSVLNDLGVEAETAVARTGVVGRIEGGGGPTVGLRADMDALPILEENGFEFDSQRSGLMHACGHDAHTAILMGAATLLKGFADEGRLPGNVRLLFQPSEEARDENGMSGAAMMIQEGALKDVDAVFGLHVDTKTEVGKVATRAGTLMAAGDTFDLTIKGFGGHGARPHLANDPILIASQVVQAINNIISRRIDPLAPGVISVCTFHAGTARNVIPETVEIGGTIRSMTQDIREQLYVELERACSIAESLGGSYKLEIQKGLPPTVCDPEATAVAFDALNPLLGTDKTFEMDPMMASEDFSYMLKEAPGAFLRLGVKNPEWDREYPVHTSTFRIDEEALLVGVASLTAVALKWMADQS